MTKLEKNKTNPFKGCGKEGWVNSGTVAGSKGKKSKEKGETRHGSSWVDGSK